MIEVTRLNESSLLINSDLIEFVEASPETIICLVTGKKIMVRESFEQIVERVAEFRRKSGARTVIPGVSDISGEGAENG